MIHVGLTGNVASGKSTIAEWWRLLGVPVVSADELARRAVAPGSAGLARVVEAFGEEVLDGEGGLDRERMRGRVFRDPEERAKLESIVHPIVWALRDEWLGEERARGAHVVVSEIPLLFETGSQGDFDTVVFVDAPLDQRLDRMVRDRGLTRSDAEAIAAAQMDPAVKRSGADHVVQNDAALSDLQERALALIGSVRRAAGVQDVLLDLHLHTAGSWDCLSDPRRVLDRARRLGYRRIAITDHNELDVALRMAEDFPDAVIPGEEVKTAEGIDVIGLYLSERIPKGTPAIETIEQIRDQGGIPYLPHPFAGGKGGGGRLARQLGELCDVIEVHNARLHDPRMNEKAAALAEELGKARGAGSDAHTLGEIGNARVELPEHPNRPESLRLALQAANCSGREAPRWVHLASTWAKVRGRLP